MGSQPCGFVSLLYSIGERPLELWSKHVSLDGRIRRIKDEALQGDKVIEIMGPHETSVPTNICCPANPLDVLRIKLPVLVLIIKNLELKLKVDFQLIDKEKQRRKITLITYDHEKLPIINIHFACLALNLEEGWNILELNLQSLCHNTFKVDFCALQKIIIYPNCRVRRIYLQDRHYNCNETPIELCQAFFDMYSLKWGIHLVERCCQTEESYTGPLQPFGLECFTSKSNISITISASTALENQGAIDNSTSVSKSDKIFMSSYSRSINEFNNYINPSIGHTLCKTKINHNSKHVTVNNENKRKCKSATFNDKEKLRGEHLKKKDKEQINLVDDVCTNLKGDKNVAESFPHVEKSQYLQMQINESFMKKKPESSGRIFKEWPYTYHEKSGDDKSYLIDFATNYKNHKNEVRHKNPNSTDLHFSATKPQTTVIPQQDELPSRLTQIAMVTSNRNWKHLEKTNGDKPQQQDVKSIKNIITEVQRIREQLRNYCPNLKNSTIIEKKKIVDVPDIIPPFVEVHANPKEANPKNTALSTDAAVNDFLKLQHLANKIILNNLRKKGLTMTEVELSIYNSINRRNCYGQGKLIETQRQCISKGTGLSSINPPEVHASLKKQLLTLSNKMCMQLKNEPNAVVSYLKPLNNCRSLEEVQHMIKSIQDVSSGPSNSYVFTAEVKSIQKKVNDEIKLHSPGHAKCILSSAKKRTNNSDTIVHSDKYDTLNVINVLFHRHIQDHYKKFKSP